MSGGCPYASPPLPSHHQLLYKWSLPPPDFRNPSHHLSSPTLQQVSSLSSTPPPPRLRPHPARDGPRGAPQDRLREVQDRGLRPEAGSLRAPQGPPVTQVHGVCMRRLARVPVGDPGPGAWRGLHRPQHRCHGPVLLQEQAHRCRVGHRVRRLRPQGRSHRGDRPQPLRRDQGPPQPQGWRRRHLPLRRGLGQDRVPGQEEGRGRVRRDAFRGPVRRLGKGGRQRVPPEPQHLPVRQGGRGQRNPQAGRRPLRLRHRQVRHMGAVNQSSLPLLKSQIYIHTYVYQDISIHRYECHMEYLLVIFQW